MIGPSPTPMPRMASISPVAPSPPAKSSVTSTARMLTVPAPRPNVAFEDSRARRTGSSLAWCSPSFMSARGRRGRRASAASRTACMGRRMVNTSTAASTKEVASATNAASRPNTAANAPPIAAPMASMAPQVEPNSAVAFLQLVVVPGQVRHGRLRGRDHEGAEGGDGGLGQEGQPDPARTDAQEDDRGDGLDAGDGDDDAAAVEAVGRGARRSGATRKPGRAWLTKTRATSRLESVRSLTRPIERDVAEPVAHVGDDLRDEERADVPVGPEHREHGAAACYPVVVTRYRRAWSSSTMASAAVIRSALGRWRYSLGPWALLPGPSTPVMTNWASGNRCAEHAHERDRAALAERAGRAAERRLRRPRSQRCLQPRRERRRVPARAGLAGRRRSPGRRRAGRR